jgi:hypothetical protein
MIQHPVWNRWRKYSVMSAMFVKVLPEEARCAVIKHEKTIWGTIQTPELNGDLQKEKPTKTRGHVLHCRSPDCSARNRPKALLLA